MQELLLTDFIDNLEYNLMIHFNINSEKTTSLSYYITVVFFNIKTSYRILQNVTRLCAFTVAFPSFPEDNPQLK